MIVQVGELERVPAGQQRELQQRRLGPHLALRGAGAAITNEIYEVGAAAEGQTRRARVAGRRERAQQAGLGAGEVAGVRSPRLPTCSSAWAISGVQPVARAASSAVVAAPWPSL